MPAPWKPLQTLRKLKLKISRTLWTSACAFSPGLLALMLDYTPSVPPLPPLKYGSDGRKGQQPVWGRQLRGRWMGGERGWGGGCVSLWAILDVHRTKDGVERGRGGWGVYGLLIVSVTQSCGPIHAWINSRSCMPHDLGPLASQGAWTASGSCTHSLELKSNSKVVY